MYYQKHLLICTNQRPEGKACCANHHAAARCTEAKLRIKDYGLAGPGRIRVSSAGCLGRCDEGPVAVVYPEGVWYQYHDEQDIQAIVDRHLVGGEIVEELLLDE